MRYKIITSTLAPTTFKVKNVKRVVMNEQGSILEFIGEDSVVLLGIRINQLTSYEKIEEV